MLSQLLFICGFILQIRCNSFYTKDVRGSAQYGYYISLYIGTPPQEINVLLDTGSSNFAVASVPSKEITNYFRYNESQTLHKSNIKLKLRYIEGSWDGFLARDVVKLYNESDAAIICQFGCMTSVSNIFVDYSPFQGILGLAYPVLSKPSSAVNPFFNEAVKQANTSDIFSLSLCGPFFPMKQETTCGKIHLGFSSNYSFTGEIIYTPIIREWFYEIIVTHFSIGKSVLALSCYKLDVNRSIVDSGTTHLRLPAVIYDWVILKIKNSIKYNFSNEFWNNEAEECIPKDKSHLIYSFPNISISFYYTKHSSFSIFVTPESYLLLSESNSSNSNICFELGIRSSTNGIIIGSTIIKSFYIIFDRHNHRIGFANSSYSEVSNKLMGFVTFPFNITRNICNKKADADNISVIAIIMGCLAIACAIFLLYMLVLWIWKQIMARDNSSEVSSLVDE